MTRHPYRMPCLVPGCRRSLGVPYDPKEWLREWICPGHWRGVSRAMKALRTRLRRRVHRIIAGAVETGPRPLLDGGAWYRDSLVEPPTVRWVKYATGGDAAEHWRLTRALGWVWRRMRKQAIEGAMGI